MPLSLRKIIAALILTVAPATFSARADISVDEPEMASKDAWLQDHLLSPGNTPPFSFFYDGKKSGELLSSWPRTMSKRPLDESRTEYDIQWTDPAGNLAVKCTAVEYADYPVVEWTMYLENIGRQNTPILQHIQGLDITVTRTNGPEFVLNGIKGDWTTPDSYQPYQISLSPSKQENFSPLANSGKSSSGPTGWPYYNLQIPGGGMILALGWPGQWASSFKRDDGNDLRIRAGQAQTHFYLKPGEKIRTPSITLLFWQGTDVVRAQNIWRRFYMDHIIPRVDGQPPSAISQIQVGGSDTDNVNRFLQAGIHPDLCWRDAGGSYTWYPGSTGPYKGNDAWLNTGTWEVDPAKYPDGFKPFSDWIHARGIKFLLWFEPERVGDPNSWLAKNHPEWLLPGESHGSILNEGDPAAFHWLTNHVENIIKTQGVDWYREDMNGEGPLRGWRNHDSPDRQGITENFYVQGHLAYWDDLLSMNPGLRIDACASGGRRNDLDTMRRAVPLTRSDFQFVDMTNVVDGNQCHTYGLSFWLPFQGSGCRFMDPYSFRSFYMAEFGMCDGISPANVAIQQQAYRESKEIAPIMINGDYYPLTPYSLSNNVWMAWQFDWPAKGEGCVQIFRRTNSAVTSMTFQLQGLAANQVYHVKNFDTGDLGSYMVSQLMSDGLKIQLNPQQSAILFYERVQAINASTSSSPQPGNARCNNFNLPVEKSQTQSWRGISKTSKKEII